LGGDAGKVPESSARGLPASGQQRKEGAVTEEAHHKFGPSTLKYIEICPGFRNSNDEEPHPVAIEGTRLHEACETGDLGGLDSDQLTLVRKCLAYANSVTAEAAEVHRELKMVINYDTSGIDSSEALADG